MASLLTAELAWADVPTVTITSPNDGSTVQVYLQVKARVTAGTNPTARVDFTVDGAVVATVLSYPWQFNWDTTSLTNGAHTLGATVYDNTAANSSSSIGVTIDNWTMPWTTVAGRSVKKVTVLSNTSSSRVDWSKSGNNLIAYDALTTNGYYQVFTMNPDGTNQTCLTCGNSTYTSNNGNPAWDPTGQYIVFQCQNPSLGDSINGASMPGGGANNDICIGTYSAGTLTNIQQITSVTNGEGTLHPHFSHSGNKLAWTQIINTGLPSNWALITADFNGAATPPVSNIQIYQPNGANKLYEIGSWSPDDVSLAYALNPTADQGSLDIYTFNLQTSATLDLTNSDSTWDEFPHYTNDGTQILWMTQKGYEGTTPLHTDYWIQNIDGSNATRLTYFNDPTAPEYISGGVSSTDEDWNADQTSIIATVKPNQNLDPQGGQTGAIVRIDLNAPPPTVATPAAATPNPAVGTTTNLSVLGASAAGESTLTYTWSTVGTPPAAVTFSANGSNAAKNTTATFTTAGSYTFLVVVKDQSGLQATSQVVVTVNQTLTSIAVTPSTVSVTINQNQSFTAVAMDQFGTNLTSQPTFTWTTTGGSINSSGVFTAPASPGGPFVVSATVGSVSGTAAVTITSGPGPTVATPAAATPNPVVATTTNLSVLGASSAGESTLTYTWSTVGTPPAAVTFSANGSNASKNTTATFTSAGSYTFQVVIKDQNNQQITSQVVVTVNQTLTSIAVTPTSVSLSINQTESFSAVAKDQFGTNLTTPPTVAWSTTGGSINSSGQFTAPASPGGPFVVDATVGSVVGTANVTVTGPAPDITPPTVAIVTPTENATVSKTVSIVVDATDNVGVTKLEFYVDGALSQTYIPQGASPFTLTWNSTLVPDGAHVLKVIGYDAAGNQSSASVDVTTVNASGPPATVLPPPVIETSGNVPVNGQVVLEYPSGYNITSYQWNFVPQAMNTATVSFSTTLPMADLSQENNLMPGVYQISVTASDGQTQSQPGSATLTLVNSQSGSIRVYPNPWRSDGKATNVTFDNLNSGSTVHLFTLSGHSIKKITASGTQLTWDLTNDDGEKVASGLYVYLITDSQGDKVRGKLSVIK